MHDDEFEWDDAKAAQNWHDHGITFGGPGGVPGRFRVEWLDDRQGAEEPRFATLGMVEHRLLFVAYTMRGDRIRIISARKAEPHERRRYHEENREA